MKTKQQELEQIYDSKINGILIRSKAISIEGNEKNSKYFSSLEKRNAEKKNIFKLKKGDIEINNQNDIIKYEKEFYKKLYSEQKQNISEYDFFNKSKNKLSEIEKTKCEGLLTEYECFEALKEMKNQKSPGSDGITSEFYKKFWDTVKQYYINAINYSYETKHLSPLQKQRIISLIPKEGKDTLLLSNWRPISLLNVDYKIAT